MAAAQSHVDAAFNLEEARRGGKEQGEKRRQELRTWIEEGGMRGMGSGIGKGNIKQRGESGMDGSRRPPDSVLDATAVEAITDELSASGA